MDKLKRELISNLQGYLRERMDFIASIPTMDPLWTAPLDIINDIIGPFLGGVKYNSNCPCSRLFLLLDNILRSEKIRAGGIDFEIKIFDSGDTNEPTYKLTSEYEIQNGEVYYKLKKLKRKDDNTFEESEIEPFKAAIYMGVSGCQAFYGIIENILRNSARHSNKKELKKIKDYSKKIENKQSVNSESEKPLKITIEFHYDYNEYKDDFLKVKIYDNMLGWENENVWVVKEKDENEKENIKLVLLTRDNVNENDIIKNLQNKDEDFKESQIFNRMFNPKYPEGRIIDETGIVMEGGWGLKEMRICASFLRGLKIEDYESPYNPPVIRPLIQEDQTDKKTGSLGVELFIPKVKKLLIISKEIYHCAKNEIENLKNQGIYIEKDINKISELVEKGSFTHEFVAINVDDNVNTKFLSANKLLLPYKTIHLSSSENGDLVINKDKLKTWLSGKNLEFEINSYKYKIRSIDEKIILEVKKMWINSLSQSYFPTIGVYPTQRTMSKHPYWDNKLTFGCDSNSIKVKNKFNICNLISNNVFLLHKFVNFDNFIKCKPISVIPFTHGVSDPITVFKKLLDNIGGTNYNFSALNLYFDILETALTNVIIIDERVFEESKNTQNIFVDVNLAFYWYLQNVLILNLDRENNKFILRGHKIINNGELTQQPQEIPIEIDSNNNQCTELSSIIPDSFRNKVHFLIIHQTIIQTKIGGKAEFEKFKDMLPKEYQPKYIIVTSGRGHPPKGEMPENTKFFDFSNLRKFIIDRPNKFLLTKILNSLKEEKDIK